MSKIAEEIGFTAVEYNMRIQFPLKLGLRE